MELSHKNPEPANKPEKKFKIERIPVYAGLGAAALSAVVAIGAATGVESEKKPEPFEGTVVEHEYDDPDKRQDVMHIAGRTTTVTKHEPERYLLEIKVGEEGKTKIVEVDKDQYSDIPDGAGVTVDSNNKVSVTVAPNRVSSSLNSGIDPHP